MRSPSTRRLGFLAAGQALQGVYAHLLTERTSLGAPVPLHDFMGFSKLMGFEAVWDFDRKHQKGGS